ncbi:vitamin B12 dependent-methionine synthase activation domain-containing protein [Chloroflexota bacterium]
MVSISNSIDIDSQQVFRNIGYCANGVPSARIESLVNEYIENTCQLIEPAYSYVIRDIIMVQGPSITLDGLVTFRSEIIARLLKQCEKVAVFVVTIGNRLEEMVCHLAEEGLMVQASVLDAIGSGVTETVADFMQDKIGGVARAQGLYTSRRFSPGYCDWEVSQQRKVYQAMNGDTAGVRLTRECLMLPQKSISGIIGIGPCEVENYNPCKTCKKRDCIGRRENLTA